MKKEKQLIFDSGPLINFAMNGSLHILERLKKEFKGDFLITKEVKDEIGDTLVYLLRLCDELNIDPIKAANDKMLKNAEKYPIEKAKGSAKKYTKL